ncbi:MAG: mycothiol synthase [bacterium]
MIQTRTLAALEPDQRSAIAALAGAVERLDGAEPLNEAALLRLANTGPRLRHLVAEDAGVLRGYAQLDRPGGTLDDAEGTVDGSGRRPATAEVLVGPQARPQTALALLTAAEAAAADAAAAEAAATAALLVWSRGHSPVGAVASERGYVERRVMEVMSRPLAGLADLSVDVPAGFTIRPFRVGADEKAWLAVNARAFAGHPEQGAWTEVDLEQRQEQDWFDPAGFLLAEDTDGHLLGYHWTKVHAAVGTGQPPVAEVYVLGIDPDGQGRGLGRALLGAGLRHLAAASGAQQVILYLEENNGTAAALYRSAGFAVTRRDVRLLGPADAG